MKVLTESTEGRVGVNEGFILTQSAVVMSGFLIACKMFRKY